MRRPLAAISLGFAAGIAAAYYMKSSLYVLLFLAAACGVSLRRRNGAADGRLRGAVMRSSVFLILAACFAGAAVMCAETAQDPFGLLRQEHMMQAAMRPDGELEIADQPGAEQENTAPGKEVTLTGRITAAEQREKALRLTVKAESEEKAEPEQEEKAGAKTKTKVLLTVWEADPDDFGSDTAAGLTGREISVRGIVSLPQKRRNPGGFDYRLYLRGQSISALMEAEPAAIRIAPADSVSPARVLAVQKEKFSQKIDRAFAAEPETGNLLLGMLFGDRSVLEEETREAFQKSGTAHLLAVSGIHVNLLYLSVRKLLFGRRDLPACAAVFACLALYAALSGFTPSAVRASLMIALNAASVLVKRDYDMCSAAAAAALLLLALQPYRLFDAGFQLSFLAAFGLGIILPWAEQKIVMLADRLKKERVAKYGGLLAPLFVIQAVMAPMTAYMFQNFSWSAFFLNPIFLIMAEFMVPAAMLLLPLSILSGTPLELLFSFGVNCAGLPARLMLAILRFLNRNGIGFSAAASPPPGIMLLFYSALFFLCSESAYILRRKKRKRAVAAVLAALLGFSFFAPYLSGAASRPGLLARAEYPLVFVDVGQGDCLHIRTRGGKNILIDGGGKANYNVGKKTLAPYLLKNGVAKIDLAVATHLHADHYKGLLELADEIPVERLAVYEGNRVREQDILQEWSAGERGRKGHIRKENGVAAGKTPQLLYAAQGDVIEPEAGVRIEVLAPERRSKEEYLALCKDETDENASSLVLRVHVYGLAVLVTGDMGFEGEQALLAQTGRTDQIDRADRTDRTAGGMSLSSHILKVGHHGSKYATSEQFLDAVAPAAAVISVGKNNFGHPGARVLALLQNYDIISYRTDRLGAIVVRRIKDGQAVLSGVCGENLWHINMEGRGSTPTRRSRRN